MKPVPGNLHGGQVGRDAGQHPNFKFERGLNILALGKPKQPAPVDLKHLTVPALVGCLLQEREHSCARLLGSGPRSLPRQPVGRRREGRRSTQTYEDSYSRSSVHVCPEPCPLRRPGTFHGSCSNFSREIRARSLRRPSLYIPDLHDPDGFCQEPGNALESLQTETPMGTSLVPGQSVNLVDDDRGHGFENVATPGSSEQEIQRLGSCHQEMRRFAQHGLACGGRRIAGPNGDADVGEGKLAGGASNLGEGLDLGERNLEIPVDIVAERLERGDVDHMGPLPQSPFEPGPNKPVNAREKGRQSLARSGRGGDKGIETPCDGRPTLGLWSGRSIEPGPEPLCDAGVEKIEDRAVRRIMSHPYTIPIRDGVINSVVALEGNNRRTFQGRNA